MKIRFIGTWACRSALLLCVILPQSAWAVLGINLLDNGSFEAENSDGSMPAGWSLTAASQASPLPIQYPDASQAEWASDPGPRTGDRYVQFVVDSSAEGVTTIVRDELIAVKSDTDYRIQMAYRFQEVDAAAINADKSRLWFGVRHYYDANPGGEPDPQFFEPPQVDYVDSLCCGAYAPAETVNWRLVEDDMRFDPDGYNIDGVIRHVAWIQLYVNPNEWFRGIVSIDDLSFKELANAEIQLPASSLGFDFVPRTCDFNSANVGASCITDADCPGKNTDNDPELETEGLCAMSPTPGFTAAPFNRQFSGEGAGEYGFEFDDIANPPLGYDRNDYPTRFLGSHLSRNARFRVKLDPGDYRLSVFMGGYWRNDPSQEQRIIDINGERLVDERENWTEPYSLKDYWYFKNVEATQVTSDDVSTSGRGYSVYDKHIAPRYRHTDLTVTVEDDGDFANLLEIVNSSSFMSGVVITPIADQAEHDAAIAAFEATLADDFVTHFGTYRPPEEFGLPIVEGNYQPVPDDQERGYLIFKRHWMDFVEFSSRPENGEPAVSELFVAATPGEFEPTTFSIWPQQLLENATVTVSDLQTPGGQETLAADAVRVWYLQQKPRRDGSTFSFIGVYLPDWGASRTLYSDVTQRVWLNVKIPEATVPGTYTGQVTFAADGVTPTVLPLTIEVRPFRLTRPPHVRSLRGAGTSKLILNYPSTDPDEPGAEDPQIHNREYYRKAAYQDLYDHGFMPDISPYFAGPLSSGFWQEDGEFDWTYGTIGGSADDQLERLAASPWASRKTMWVDAALGRPREAFESEGGTEWSREDVANWLASIEAKMVGEHGVETVYLHATAEESHYEGSGWTDYLDFIRVYRNTGYQGSGAWPHIYTVHTTNTVTGQPEALEHADFPFLGMFHGVSRPSRSEQVAQAKATGKPYGLYGMRGRFGAGFFTWRSGATGSFHEFYDPYSGVLNDDWDAWDPETGENPGWTLATYSQTGRMVGTWYWEELREGVDDDAYLATLDRWIELYDCEASASAACTEALTTRQTISDSIDLDSLESVGDSEQMGTTGRYSRTGLSLERPIEPHEFDALRTLAANAIENLAGPDSDGDLMPDEIDNCPSISNPGQEDADGNSVGDACNDLEDGDGDDWADGLDNCSLDSNPGQEDTDGNGIGDACNSAEDGDGDDWADALDNCFQDANSDQADTDGNGIGDACNSSEDGDGDDWADALDNCFQDANTDQADTDGNGIGDACNAFEDADNDEYADGLDNCPAVANPGQSDLDGDEAGDLCDSDQDGDGTENQSDNCPLASNPDQSDLDLDLLGDVCDADRDNDTVENDADNCPDVVNEGQEDTDADGLGDACNDAEDADGDEFSDSLDNCPLDANPLQEDADGDGTGDACNTAPDMDADGWADSVDNCSEDPNPLQEDADFDGYGNYCDADFNDNGFVNVQDYVIFSGAYSSDYTDARYLPVVDQNSNGYINVQDHGRFSLGYNRGIPGPSGLECAGAQPGDADYPCRSRSDDVDGDGVADETDNCPNSWNPNQAEICTDTDVDGILDVTDNCPDLWNPEQLNFDGDAEGNLCDADDDNDGLLDAVENGTGAFVDANQTGTDPLNPDSDGDGMTDGVEVTQGSDPNRADAAAVPLLGPLGVVSLITLLLAGAGSLLAGRRQKGRG